MSASSAQTRPTGTVTFLFTDLESSTRLWEEHPEAMQPALARHDELLRTAMTECGGYLFGTAGDAVSVAFGDVRQAVRAAAEAQRRLRAEPWPAPVELRARMGIHTGVAQERDGDYFGPTLNRTARICAAGHGGQVLLSEVSATLVGDAWELDDLGVHWLKDLPQPERLWQVIVDSDRSAYPSLRNTARSRHNLPVARTAFHGRDDEIGLLTERLSSERLLTLTGPGGVGKTRLALEVATGALADHEIVVFVDLSPIETPGGVAEAVLAAASLPVDVARPAQLDKLSRAWRSRSVLLVLDNCEHVLDEAAELVDRLTGTCPAVVVLATSREPLGLDGEHLHRVPSLEREAAARLFTDRARNVRPDLAIDAAGEETIEEICDRLDGLPLALELAASRVAHMGLAEIAAHLDDRFRLLTGSRRRSLRRQQTLQATVDWSHDLLDEAERSLLRAAAVFVGRFDLEALAAVWGGDELATVDHLGSLVDKSLVTVVDDDARGTVHYRLLETIRLYAQERLVAAGEAEVRRESHARHLLDRARAHPPRIVDLVPWGTSSSGATPSLENHLEALHWFEERGELAAVGQLSGRLGTVLGHGRFLDVSGDYLGREDVLDALADPAEQALYLTASAVNANYLGRYRDQLAFAERAFALAEDPGTRGAAANWLGNALTVFEPERVPAVAEEGLRELPENAHVTRLMLRAQPGLAAIAEGRLADAVEHLTPLIDAPDAFPATELLLVRHLLGDDVRAGLSGVEARAQGSPWAYRVPLVEALAAAASGDHDVAVDAMGTAAEAAGDYPLQMLDHDVLVGCAGLAHHRGEIEHASHLLAVVGGRMRSPGSFAVYRHYRDLVRAHLPRQRRRDIIESTAGLEPFEVLEEELQRLRRQASTD